MYGLVRRERGREKIDDIKYNPKINNKDRKSVYLTSRLAMSIVIELRPAVDIFFIRVNPSRSRSTQYSIAFSHMDISNSFAKSGGRLFLWRVKNSPVCVK